MERLYVKLQSCRISEYMGTTRCQQLGHISSFCQRPVMCIKCREEGHHVTRCMKIGGAIKCVDCIRAGFKDTVEKLPMCCNPLNQSSEVD